MTKHDLEARWHGTAVRLLAGDITQVSVDAVVNAANSALAGGGGVDGAIHAAAGPSVMTERRERYHGCPTGSAVIAAVRAWLTSHPRSGLQDIVFVLRGDEIMAAFRGALQRVEQEAT